MNFLVVAALRLGQPKVGTHKFQWVSQSSFMRFIVKKLGPHGKGSGPFIH